ATKKRKQIIDDVCSSLKIVQQAGVFYIKLTQNELSAISSAMVRLAQACIRIADLLFTQRIQNFAPFENEIEEFIASTELPYESEVEMIGKFGKVVKVDFTVSGRHVHSLVQTLS